MQFIILNIYESFCKKKKKDVMSPEVRYIKHIKYCTYKYLRLGKVIDSFVVYTMQLTLYYHSLT